MPSLNGLVDINADTVTTTDLLSNDIQTVSLEVNGVDIGAQVEENKQKLTAISYLSTPTPTTTINSNETVNGEIRIYDPANPNDYIRLFHDISQYGFKFQLESINQIMYFKVKNGTNPGDYKTFYFSAGQLYCDLYFFLANNMTVDYNKRLCFGDYNNGNPYGGSIIFVPASNPWDGWQFKNTGIQPAGVIYYTNFSNYDVSGVETQTFRMNYNTIWSLVQHIFNNNITVAGTSSLSNTSISGTLNVSSTSNLSNTSISGTLNVSSTSNLSNTTITGLTVSGTSNLSNTAITGTLNVSSALAVLGASSLKSIFGTSLFISGGSTFNNTIVADSISVINATNLNGNLNAISTSNFIGTATFSGPAVFNNSLNAGYGSFTTLLLSSSLTCGSINCSGDIVAYGSITINGGFPNTLTGSLVVNNTISTNNTITQTGTTASTNRIIQPRIYTDVTTYPNVLKYTQIRYNSGSVTDKPALQCIDDNGGLSLNFCPNVGNGSYGPISQTNDRLIIAVNGDGSASALDLSTYGPTGKHGIRINHASSTDYTTQIWANSYNFKVNSITGISATVGTNSLVMNSTNTTIAGPITFSNAITANGSTALNGAVLLGTTTLLNNNILQYGSSIINQDMSGTYSGTNMLKITNITQSTSGTETPALLINDSSSETKLMFLPNSGSGSYNSLSSLNYQSIIGGGSTADSANFVLSTWSTLKNGIKMSATSSTNAQTELWAGTSSNIILNNSTGVTVANTASITYTDSSIQTTAYTSAKDTKLNNIGSITTASLTASTTLTTATFFNCGSLTLSAGTYMLTLNCCMAVITGATTVSQLLMAPSTSSTALSSNTNLSIINGGAISYGVGAQWVLTTSAIVSPTVSTTYYMLCQAGFGTASRLQFANGNSGFQAIRIA